MQHMCSLFRKLTIQELKDQIQNIYEIDIYCNTTNVKAAYCFSLLTSFPSLHKNLFSLAIFQEFLESSVCQSPPCYFSVLYTFKHLQPGHHFKKDMCHRLESHSKIIFQWAEMSLSHSNKPHAGDLKEEYSFQCYSGVILIWVLFSSQNLALLGI